MESQAFSSRTLGFSALLHGAVVVAAIWAAGQALSPTGDGINRRVTWEAAAVEPSFTEPEPLEPPRQEPSPQDQQVAEPELRDPWPPPEESPDPAPCPVMQVWMPRSPADWLPLERTRGVQVRHAPPPPPPGAAPPAPTPTTVPATRAVQTVASSTPAAPAPVASPPAAPAARRSRAPVVVPRPRNMGRYFARLKRRAQRSRWRGSVEIEVRIDERGQPIGARVSKSSGRRTLDEGVRSSVLSWAFHPARQGDRAVPGRLFIPFHF